MEERKQALAVATVEAQHQLGERGRREVSIQLGEAALLEDVFQLPQAVAPQREQPGRELIGDGSRSMS
ncbi:MAG TPA: hypothetical protein VGB85_09270 [Nannocystis sp.]